MKSVNPATGETLKTFETLDARAAGERVAAAAEAFAGWKRTSFDERAARLVRAAEILERNAAEFGRLMTLEMGKTIGAAEDEARKCARGCRYYAEHGARLLADEAVATEAASSYVRYEPFGVILAIMPWNFPFWQVIRFAAPALMAGNAVLLKHASNVPQCAVALETLWRDAGLPEHVFQTLLIGSDQIGPLLDDTRITAVTLTGSEGAGRDVAARSGRNLKKVVLELGGSDPFVVMRSANLEAAIATGVKARTINNGQSCIAAKRFIVASAIADRFVPKFTEAMAALRVGDPLDRSTDVGPLATATLVNELDAQVRRTIDAGATVLTGAKRLPGAGNFYAPTVLTNIPAESPAYRDELFGPVASVLIASDLDDSVRLANDSRFGLGASVWTTDANERARLVRDLEAGQVFVNAMVASDPRVPFGGVKSSGYGRELGAQGIREFVNVKTVWVA
jgi:succinate-semialdehyde dehydrogenase/glutarate-semialdehyde dehydrogenase